MGRSYFNAHNPLNWKWANFGKTAVGAIQIAAGAALIYAVPGQGDRGFDFILTGLGCLGLGVAAKWVRAVKDAKIIPLNGNGWRR